MSIETRSLLLTEDVPSADVTSEGGLFLAVSTHARKPCPLKTRDEGRGYLCCDLVRQDGTRITRKVHKLVYEAFIGPVPKGYHIDHLDHDKTNNRLSNLRLRKAGENSADCAKTSRAGTKTLTIKQRAAINDLTRAGWATSAVASVLGVGLTTVRRFKKIKHADPA